jgi:hypothetical protein
MKKLTCLAAVLSTLVLSACATNNKAPNAVSENDESVITIYMPLERVAAKEIETQHTSKPEEHPKTPEHEPPKTQKSESPKAESDGKKKSDPEKNKTPNTPTSVSEPTGTKSDDEDLGIPTRLYRPRFRNSARSHSPQYVPALLAILLVSALAIF